MGGDEVYFQEPPNLLVKYPCIVYIRDGGDTDYANDRPYTHTKRYQVTVIDRDPDSLIPGRVAALPMCSRQRFFVVDGLNHDVFTLYF